MTRHPALAVALSLLFFIGACGPCRQDAEAANTGIDGAFAAAFPNGATEKDANGNTLTFVAKQLVTVNPAGGVQALISEGSLGQDASHVDTGALRITYLNSSDGADNAADGEVDIRAAQIAGANATWDSYFRDHPDEAPKTDGGQRLNRQQHYQRDRQHAAIKATPIEGQTI